MNDKTYIGRELFELSHEIFKLHADMDDANVSYDDIQAGMHRCFSRLAYLLIANRKWHMSEHPLGKIRENNIFSCSRK
jgi:hypothetical protein